MRNFKIILFVIKNVRKKWRSNKLITRISQLLSKMWQNDNLSSCRSLIIEKKLSEPRAQKYKKKMFSIEFFCFSHKTIQISNLSEAC